MKFDLHCHTKEGSLDSKMPVYKYVLEYKKLGYDGIMIADHNKYRGCKEWDRIHSLPGLRDFTIIRGLEYDTKDAVHVLVIMPDGMYLPLLNVRGMRCRKLIEVVHACGGILGLAHPYGSKGSSAMWFRRMDEEFIKDMDFIEVFNTCELKESNRQAQRLAEEYDLPGFAGTDSHNDKYIGMAATEIDAEIKSNNDFIRAVKEGKVTSAGGVERLQPMKGKAKEHWSGVLLYKAFNRGLGKATVVWRNASPYRLTHTSSMAHLFEKEQ